MTDQPTHPRPASSSGDLAAVQVRSEPHGVGDFACTGHLMTPAEVEDYLVRNTDWMPGDDPREFLTVDEPWCPEHGYGCEPQDCPCGHTLRCDCWEIANER